MRPPRDRAEKGPFRVRHHPVLSDRRDRRRGVLLPTVLLLVLSLGAISMSAFVLVSTQRLLGSGEIGHVEERVAAEDALRSPARDPRPGGLLRSDVELSGGFTLVTVAPPNRGYAYLGVQWAPNVDSIVQRFPSAVRLGGTATEGGIERMDGCPSAATRPLVELSSATESGPPWPGIGILGVRELLALTGTEVADGGRLPGTDPARIFSAPPGATILGGSGAGLLLSEGSLALDGSSRFRGLVIVGGHLSIRGSAGIEGIVLSAGSVEISDRAGLFGCPDLARLGLELDAVDRGHPLSGAWFLGRHPAG